MLMELLFVSADDLFCHDFRWLKVCKKKATLLVSLFMQIVFVLVLAGEGWAQTLVKDINPGTNDGNPHNFAVVNDLLFFSASSQTYGGYESLWRSDGTEAGTIKLFDGDYSAQLTPVGDRLFCTIGFKSAGVLHVSDGTPTGTDQVTTTPLQIPSENWFTSYKNQLFFAADDGTNGVELWKSDGTPGGTQMVANIIPNSGCGTHHANPEHLTVCGDTLYFFASWPRPSDCSVFHGGLYKTDGTTISLIRWMSSHTEDFWGLNTVCYQDELYFHGSESTDSADMELYKTDGTTVELVKNINQSAGRGSDVDNLTVCNDLLFFSADDDVHGNELWVSDGTTSGTTLLKDIREGDRGTYYGHFYCYNDTLYFPAGPDDYYWKELWSSDGTPAGTGEVFQSPKVAFASGPDFMELNGDLYFRGRISRGNWGLYRLSNNAGVYLTDINPKKDEGYEARNLAAVNGRIFMDINSEEYGEELFSYTPIIGHSGGNGILFLITPVIQANSRHQ